MKNNLNTNKILILGASGRVGKEIYKILKNNFPDSKNNVFGTYHNKKNDHLEHLDLNDLSEIKNIFKTIQPNILIHTAGMIYPIECEENQDLAWNVNVIGTKNIVECCKKYNCKLVYLSSDYVFDGIENIYDESHVVNPINFYGKTKSESEKLVLDLEDSLIVRTAWVNDYDKNSKSFVMQVINSLNNKNFFNAPSDQFGHPTLSHNLAEIVIELIHKKSTGIFNVAGLTFIDRYNFAKKIAETFSLDSSFIHEVSTAELHQPIKRPSRIQLDFKKIQSTVSTKLLTLNEQLESIKNS
tara:strand:- start:105 stop:998 length:894 start_codon:yes stop_codon:yes gene_type:complete